MTIYAVNGKEPIAAWIPSLDTAGNGTTTLTDLVSTNTGTLTNFALSGSTSNWVADTGSGGVRALDFDGSNDRVLVSSNLGLSSLSLSYSCWAKLNNTNNAKTLLCLGRDNTSRNAIYLDQGGQNISVYKFVNSSFFSFSSSASTVTSTGVWYHFGLTINSTSAVIWINGTSYSGTLSGGFPSSTNKFCIGNFIDSNGSFLNPHSGRIDDVRIFNSVLDSTDIAYLYNSGAGRGRVSATSNKNNMQMGVAF